MHIMKAVMKYTKHTFTGTETISLGYWEEE